MRTRADDRASPEDPALSSPDADGWASVRAAWNGPTSMAVLDTAGTITAVNAAWRAFALANAGSERACCVGASYLEVAREGAGAGAPAAADVVRALERLLGGDSGMLEIRYSCDSPHRCRSFVAIFEAVEREGRRYVFVTHEAAERR